MEDTTKKSMPTIRKTVETTTKRLIGNVNEFLKHKSSEEVTVERSGWVVGKERGGDREVEDGEKHFDATIGEDNVHING